MNPYEILGVSSSASDSEIKKAFRELSKKYHPDVCKEKDAEQKFKEINDAYIILSDPQKKSNYDTYGSAEGPNFSQANDFNGFPGFDGFGGFNGFNPFHTSYNRKSGESLQYNVSLSLYEACFGTRKSLSYSRLVPCDDCKGVGGEGESVCPTCHGSGTVTRANGMWMETTTCPHCKGRGKVLTKTCSKCQGTGKVNKTETPTVTIPPGCVPGDRLRVRGKGNVGDGGKNFGDLIISVNILPDSKYHLNGYDLETVETVNVAQALIGGKKEVELLDRNDSGESKKIKITIPPGSAAGTRLRVPGKGFNKKNGQRGDLYIVLDLDIPNMTSKRDLVEEFASKAGMPLES